DLAYIVHNYGQHPAYLRRNGLPVIQQFNGYGETDVGSRKLTPEEFKQVFAALPTRVAYVRQNLDEAYHPLIPAAYVWWDQGDWPARFAKRCAELRERGKLEFFMTMVCPGFDDTGVWGWGNGPRKSRGYGQDVHEGTVDPAVNG